MNTKEMLDTALQLAGLDECPADTAEIVPGENIRRVLAGLDINNAELALGKLAGYDLVVGHHTRTEDLKGCSKLMESLPKAYLISHGVSPIEAERCVEGRAKKADQWKNPMDHNREAMGAKTLQLPFMTIHTPAALIAQKTVQSDLDAKFGTDPFVTLSEVVDALKAYPETAAAAVPPVILVGEPDSHAGKIAVLFAGVHESLFMDGYWPAMDDRPILKALYRNGYGTVIVKCPTQELVDAVKEQKIGNLIGIPHTAADSIGMNRIVKQWRAQGLQVDTFCGLEG